MAVTISTSHRAGGKGSSVSRFAVTEATIATAQHVYQAQYVCQDRCPCWQKLLFRSYMVRTRTPTQPSILCPRLGEKNKATKELRSKETTTLN